MGIQSIIGDVKSNVGQRITSVLDTMYGQVSGLANNAGTFVANVWDGGFAGINESGLADLKQAIESYKNANIDLINEYNEAADLDVTFKGDVQAAVQEFVRNTKELLNAWVSAVEFWSKELDEYALNYKAGASNLASNISSDAQEVKAAASDVDLG